MPNTPHLLMSMYVAEVSVPMPGSSVLARVRFGRKEDYPLTIQFPVDDDALCNVILDRLCTLGGASVQDTPPGGVDTLPDTLTMFLAAVDASGDATHDEVRLDALEALEPRSEALAAVVRDMRDLRRRLAQAEAQVKVTEEDLRERLVRYDVNATRVSERHREEVATLTADVSRRRGELATLRASLRNCEAELLSYRSGESASVAELSAVVEKQRADLARYERESAALTEELDALRVRLATAEDAAARVTNADEAVATATQRFKLAEVQRAQAQKDLSDVQAVLSADRLKHAEELKVASADVSRLRDQLRGAGVALQTASDTAAEILATEREARSLAEDTVAALRRELADTIAARALAESELVRVTKERDDLTTAMQDRLRAAELDLRDAARFEGPSSPSVHDAPPRGPDLTVMHDPTDEEEAARLARHAGLSAAPVAPEAWSYDTAERIGTLCAVCSSPQVMFPGGETCENGHGGAPGIDPLAPPEEAPAVAQDSPLTPSTTPPVVTVRGLPDKLSDAVHATLIASRYFKDIVVALHQDRPEWTRADITDWVVRHRDEYPVLRRLPAEMVAGRVGNLAESFGIR